MKNQNNLIIKSGTANMDQTLDDRQRQVISTCTESCCNIAYPLLGLIEETGELFDKLFTHGMLTWNDMNDKTTNCAIINIYEEIRKASEIASTLAKAIRHGSIPVPFDIHHDIATEYSKDMLKLRYEMGDIKWMADALDFFMFTKAMNGMNEATAQETAMMNWMKLKNRVENNTIDGKGDIDRKPID